MPCAIILLRAQEMRVPGLQERVPGLQERLFPGGTCCFYNMQISVSWFCNLVKI